MHSAHSRAPQVDAEAISDRPARPATVRFPFISSSIRGHRGQYYSELRVYPHVDITHRYSDSDPRSNIYTI